MSVLLRIGNRKAFLAAGQWTSASARLERELNEATRSWFQEAGGPPIRDPDQERAVAEEMARRYGGDIAVYLRSASRASSKAFLQQRQMQLDFTAAPLTFVAKAVGGRPRKAKKAAAE